MDSQAPSTVKRLIYLVDSPPYLNRLIYVPLQVVNGEPDFPKFIDLENEVGRIRTFRLKSRGSGGDRTIPSYQHSPPELIPLRR